MPEFKTVEVIADIISHEMDIPSGQIALYDQSVPSASQLTGLHIAIDILEKEVLNNNVRHESRDGDADLWQVQTMQVREHICIHVFSADEEAHERNHEIVFALGSTYAQQVQEEYGMGIGRIPSAYIKVFDAAQTPPVNHYTITITAQRSHFKESKVDYYDKFQPAEIITDPANHNSTP